MTENSSDSDDDEIIIFYFDEEVNGKQEVDISTEQFAKSTGLSNHLVGRISGFLGLEFQEPGPSPRILSVIQLLNETIEFCNDQTR
jgi:hypothetical protein